MRDYSSLINPRHRVSQLTSEQEESKPVRFVERRRRSAVEEVGSRANNVHLHQFENVGAKVRSGVGCSFTECLVRLTASVWRDTSAAVSWTQSSPRDPTPSD